MSLKETFDKEVSKAKAEAESVGWVHDERVIHHEQERIEQAEKELEHHEDILEANSLLKDGLINRIEDDIENALVSHDKKVIAAAQEKIEEMKEKQAEHQDKIDENKQIVYDIEDKQANS